MYIHSFISTTTNTPLSSYFNNHPILTIQPSLCSHSYPLNYQSISLLGKTSSSHTFFHITSTTSFQLLSTQIHFLIPHILWLFFYLIRFLFSSYFTTTNYQASLAHEGLNPPSLFFFPFHIHPLPQSKSHSFRWNRHA